ncbi:hypothetical protein [Streptomyces prasinopilosus]|uniref:Uncharacterized protein n=1 Tax=Streptomyces prasinopilosus TaxID=67344 RepID=A0A1G6TP40_9ACTN|nr:hypothetical protein [Streptomyces prasinopilosus]SDD30942.1 hypothetical protein SAMN05216505_106280 [Streptomyces prasinopilosus]
MYGTRVLARPRLCTAGYLSRTAVRDILTAHAAGHDRARPLRGLRVLELSFPGPSA